MAQLHVAVMTKPHKVPHKAPCNLDAVVQLLGVKKEVFHVFRFSFGALLHEWYRDNRLEFDILVVPSRCEGTERKINFCAN